jgi:hypothetical protein
VWSFPMTDSCGIPWRTSGSQLLDAPCGPGVSP